MVKEQAAEEREEKVVKLLYDGFRSFFLLPHGYNASSYHFLMVVMTMLGQGRKEDAMVTGATVVCSGFLT